MRLLHVRTRIKDMHQLLCRKCEYVTIKPVEDTQLVGDIVVFPGCFYQGTPSL